jgi:molecular chaperone DnaJ
VIVETPIHLTKKQKELLEELESTFAEPNSSHSPRTNSWFEGVKQFFDELKE